MAAAWRGLLLMPSTARDVPGERARERVASDDEIAAVRRRYERIFEELATAARP